MKEDQNVEWKETWKDEYIKWVCGFANANGGLLVIGKNDSGEITGVTNSKKLLEDIPNKVRDILGIIVDVNLKTDETKVYLEILIEPYPYPVNYKGEYFYRSGSTKQELKGAALDKFLLKKQGKHWDGVPVPQVTIADFKNDSLQLFRSKAAKSGRISEEILGESNKILIDNLQLKEGAYIKRAAILLFHPNPEKYVNGAYIKIGFFRTDDDLLYQDEIHGNLFNQADKTLDLLLTKYLRANISYEGIQRIEKYPFPKAALREALLNAIVHKDYSSGVPIQISVYEDKIIFWNDGQLPENWTIEQLLKKHPSKPYNPLIANAFFRAGLIESWGRGIQKINSECTLANVPIPEYKYDFSGVMLIFNARTGEKTGKGFGEKVSNTMIKENLFETQQKILELFIINPRISAKQLSGIIGISTRNIEINIQKLKEKGILKRIGPANGGYWKIKKDFK